MSCFLGIDTSNYTTSVAIYDNASNKMISSKKLLEVKKNSVGLRQSDAVFLHTKQFYEVLNEAVLNAGTTDFCAVGASVSPRDVAGSYMPCFLVGENIAKSIAKTKNLPFYSFSHQAGHVAAALYCVNRLDFADKEFMAFHVSGGTTDVLHIKPDNDKIFNIDCIGKSLDLKAGQAIDRVGVKLSLNFPCGPELEKLALNSDKKYKIKPYIKDYDCSLSGIENKVNDMISAGVSKEDIAKFCIEYINITIERICEKITTEYPNLPIVFSGGVMSNKIIKENIESKFQSYFAEPKYSSDNAAGISILTCLKHEREN